MFWLVDMRLHFHFAASDLILGLGHSDYICTGQAKWHAQDQRNACARLVQLVRSLTANQEVPGSSPGLVEG